MKPHLRARRLEQIRESQPVVDKMKDRCLKWRLMNNVGHMAEEEEFVNGAAIRFVFTLGMVDFWPSTGTWCMYVPGVGLADRGNALMDHPFGETLLEEVDKLSPPLAFDQNKGSEIEWLSMQKPLAPPSNTVNVEE